MQWWFMLDGLDYEVVRLTMPKLETESAFGLSDTLKDMGMTNGFDESSADFSGMDGRSCQERGDICMMISDVLHKAFVSVDEAGTEAAAATAVSGGITQAFTPEETCGRADHRPSIHLFHTGPGNRICRFPRPDSEPEMKNGTLDAAGIPRMIKGPRQ